MYKEDGFVSIPYPNKVFFLKTLYTSLYLIFFRLQIYFRPVAELVFTIAKDKRRLQEH